MTRPVVTSINITKRANTTVKGPHSSGPVVKGPAFKDATGKLPDVKGPAVKHFAKTIPISSEVPKKVVIPKTFSESTVAKPEGPKKLVIPIQ